MSHWDTLTVSSGAPNRRLIAFANPASGWGVMTNPYFLIHRPTTSLLTPNADATAEYVPNSEKAVSRMLLGGSVPILRSPDS